MKSQNRKAFTLVEIMAASAIMTLIVLGVLIITTNILNTWSRASGQLQTYFDAAVVGSIIQEDFESIKIRKDGRAWLQVAYPQSVGLLTGEDDMDSVPLRPPEIMFYSPTMLRPRYTREHIAYLIILCTLKSVLPLPVISKMLETRLQSQSVDVVYDCFCDIAEKRMRQIAEMVRTAGDDSANLPFEAALLSATGAYLAQYLTKQFL